MGYLNFFKGAKLEMFLSLDPDLYRYSLFEIKLIKGKMPNMCLICKKGYRKNPLGKFRYC